MFAEIWSVVHFFRERFKACGQDSNRDTAWHAAGHLQQIGVDVDDLVLAVPFAGEEVLQAVGLKLIRVVDETVLVSPGVVSERVNVHCHPAADFEEVRRDKDSPTSTSANGRHDPGIYGLW